MKGCFAVKNQKKSQCVRISFHVVLITIISLFSMAAQAHAPSENYVWLNVEVDHISGRFEVNLKDVESKLGLIIDREGIPRLEALHNSAEQVQQYILGNLNIYNEGKLLKLKFLKPTILEDTDYLQYHFRIDEPLTSQLLQIHNSLFLTPDMMRGDRLHKSMVVYEYDRVADLEFGDESVALVFSPNRTEKELNLLKPEGILQWRDFLWQGVLHIWFGWDHIVFIVLLLLTTVLRRGEYALQAVDSFREAFFNTVKVVTIFTLAHSVTLSLAALDLVRLNTSIVESIIALSIVVVAVCNVFPKFRTHTWALILLFGLFHGLGFASVLGDLQFRNVFVERILVLFNVGVELGQLAIVVILFPILFILSRRIPYQRMVVVPVSVLAGAIGLFWAVERSGLIS